jgi:hypothetical protein
MGEFKNKLQPIIDKLLFFAKAADGSVGHRRACLALGLSQLHIGQWPIHLRKLCF